VALAFYTMKCFSRYYSLAGSDLVCIWLHRLYSTKNGAPHPVCSVI